jgi:peptidoglycan/LPS O-acetylase OafA/YrhL
MDQLGTTCTPTSESGWLRRVDGGQRAAELGVEPDGLVQGDVGVLGWCRLVLSHVAIVLRVSDIRPALTGARTPAYRVRLVQEPRRRIGSLDGLRGVAALVVLVHHSLVSIGPLGGVYFEEATPAGLEWLVFSPLHLIWAGPEAVYVFFILSGLVLTLPTLRRRYHWKSYYPSRLLRLYIPVAAAVLFAIAIALVVPRSLTDEHGTWMEKQDQPLSLFSTIRNMTLVSPDWLNPPLWSLRWEVAFSVLLPLYIFVLLRFTKWWPLLIVGAIAVSTIGTLVHDKGVLVYLPMFLIGSALAVGLQPSERVGERRWPWLMGAGLLGITASWWLAPTAFDADAISIPIVLVSALLIVVGAIRWGAAQRVLEHPVVQWLGRISFSLYLTHDPIVVAVNTLLPIGKAWWTPVIAIPLALVVAVLFFRFVEAPAHRLAKQVGGYFKPKPTGEVAAPALP